MSIFVFDQNPDGYKEISFMVTKTRKLVEISWIANNNDPEIGVTINLSDYDGLFMGLSVWKLQIWVRIFPRI